MRSKEQLFGEALIVSNLALAMPSRTDRISVRKQDFAQSVSRAAIAVFTLMAASLLWAGDGQYTQRGGVSRSGAYDNEIFLTPENVNTTDFGSLYSYPVDGTVAAHCGRQQCR